MNALTTTQFTKQTGTIRDLIVARCQEHEDATLFTREFYGTVIQLVMDSETATDPGFCVASRELFPELKGDSAQEIKIWWELLLVWYIGILSDRERQLFKTMEVCWP